MKRVNSRKGKNQYKKITKHFKLLLNLIENAYELLFQLFKSHTADSNKIFYTIFVYVCQNQDALLTKITKTKFAVSSERLSGNNHTKYSLLETFIKMKLNSFILM